MILFSYKNTKELLDKMHSGEMAAEIKDSLQDCFEERLNDAYVLKLVEVYFDDYDCEHILWEEISAQSNALAKKLALYILNAYHDYLNEKQAPLEEPTYDDSISLNKLIPVSLFFHSMNFDKCNLHLL